MTSNAIRAAEARPADNPERAAFMRLLTEHEDLVGRLFLGTGSKATLLEAFRMSRRQVVAAYDRASLRVEAKR